MPIDVKMISDGFISTVKRQSMDKKKFFQVQNIICNSLFESKKMVVRQKKLEIMLSRYGLLHTDFETL